MISDLDVGRIVEFLGRWSNSATSIPARPQPQRILVHCSCGAAIATCGKKETCSYCGAAIEVVRCVLTPHGPKYKLRINKHPWKTEPLLWPLVLQPAGTTHQRWHLLGPRDRYEDYIFWGLETLLAVLVLLILLCAPTPMEQNPPHHYVRYYIHVPDGRGGQYNIPQWKRVDDPVTD
jgi:hypothetical protein